MYQLVLFVCVIISYLHGADVEIPAQHDDYSIQATFPTLFTLSLQALAKLPPQDFEKWRDISPPIQQQCIRMHGLTYDPTLFVLHDAAEHPKYICNRVIQNNHIRLNNQYINLVIHTEEFIPQEDPYADHDSPTSYIICPDAHCAYLKDNHLYIGTQQGELHHYEITRCAPKLVDIQRIAQHDIHALIAHPTIEHLIACASHNKLSVYQKHNTCWRRHRNIERNERHQGAIRKIAFSPSGKWLAYACGLKTYIYDLQEQREHATLLYQADHIQALQFNNDHELIMNTREGKLNLQHLLIWHIHSNKPANYLIWPDTTKIMLDQDGSCLFDPACDHTWLTHISSKILFKLILAHIDNQKDFNAFKDYKDSLICDDQPLFKLIAINNKTEELKKKQNSSSRNMLQ